MKTVLWLMGRSLWPAVTLVAFLLVLHPSLSSAATKISGTWTKLGDQGAESTMQTFGADSYWPAATSNAAFFRINGGAIICGGGDFWYLGRGNSIWSINSLSQCCLFNDTLEAWTWCNSTHFTPSLAKPASWVHVQSNSIWVYGGKQLNSSYISGSDQIQPLQRMFRANLTIGSATPLSDWEEITILGTVFPPATMGASTWTSASGIFYYGGGQPSADWTHYSPSNFIYKFYPATSVWVNLRENAPIDWFDDGVEASTWTPRTLTYSATAMDGQYVWQFGGLSPDWPNGPDVSIWRFNTVSGWWAKMNGDVSRYGFSNFTARGFFDVGNVPQPRRGGGMVVAAGLVWIFGGFTDCGPTSEMWVYDPAISKWAIVGQGTGNWYAHNTSWPGVSINAAIWASGNSIYLFGGGGHEDWKDDLRAKSSLWRFDISITNEERPGPDPELIPLESPGLQRKTYTSCDPQVPAPGTASTFCIAESTNVMTSGFLGNVDISLANAKHTLPIDHSGYIWNFGNVSKSFYLQTSGEDRTQVALDSNILFSASDVGLPTNIDPWSSRGTAPYRKLVTLNPGATKIDLYFFNNGGGPGCQYTMLLPTDLSIGIPFDASFISTTPVAIYPPSVPVPVASPAVSPAVTPTATPTAVPVATPTATPTVPPVATPAATPAPTPTATPAAVPVATPAASNPVVAPVANPVATPTLQPTSSQPIAVPTSNAPTGSPSAAPAEVPSSAPIQPPSGQQPPASTPVQPTSPTAEQPNQSPVAAAPSGSSSPTPNASSGVTVDLFTGTDATGTPVASLIVQTINLNFSAPQTPHPSITSGSPWSAQLSGVLFPQPGSKKRSNPVTKYLRITSDDGFRFYSNGSVVIESWQITASATQTIFNLTLQDTGHEFDITFFTSDGTASLILDWSDSSSGPWTLVPAAAFLGSAPLSARVAPQASPSSSNSLSSPATSDSTNVGGIVGGVIVGVIVVVAVVIAFIWWRNKKSKESSNRSQKEKAPVAAQESTPTAKKPKTVAVEEDSSEEEQEEENDESESESEENDEEDEEEEEVDDSYSESRSQTQYAPAPALEDIDMSESEKIEKDKAIIVKDFKEEWMIDFDMIEIGDKIGSGAFGVVYTGTYNAEDVAIKQCNIIANDVAITEFRREAVLLLSLKPHPSIVQVLGISIPPDSKSIYMVMEYCEGGSLDKFMEARKLEDDVKIGMIDSIARGLVHLHRNNVVHRDLAARNILIAGGNKAKISDFGMSRIVDTFAQKNTTAAGIGPIRWMAPESLSKREYSLASDVWTFAIVCWEIWTGKLPWEEESDLLSLALKIRGEGAHPDIPDSMPHWLQNLLSKCWALQQDQRPTMVEVAAAIRKHKAESMKM